jgi:hypothetical protein
MFHEKPLLQWVPDFKKHLVPQKPVDPPQKKYGFYKNGLTWRRYLIYLVPIETSISDSGSPAAAGPCEALTAVIRIGLSLPCG